MVSAQWVDAAPVSFRTAICKKCLWTKFGNPLNSFIGACVLHRLLEVYEHIDDDTFDSLGQSFHWQRAREPRALRRWQRHCGRRWPLPSNETLPRTSSGRVDAGFHTTSKPDRRAKMATGILYYDYDDNDNDYVDAIRIVFTLFTLTNSCAMLLQQCATKHSCDVGNAPDPTRYVNWSNHQTPWCSNNALPDINALTDINEKPRKNGRARGNMQWRTRGVHIL